MAPFELAQVRDHDHRGSPDSAEPFDGGGGAGEGAGSGERTACGDRLPPPDGVQVGDVMPELQISSSEQICEKSGQTRLSMSSHPGSQPMPSHRASGRYTAS